MTNMTPSTSYSGLNPTILFIQTLVIVPFFMLVVGNGQTPVQFSLLGQAYEFTSLGVFLILVAINVGLFCFIQFNQLAHAMQRQQLRASKKTTDAQVSAEVSDAKVKALEAKIETLEKALEKALKHS
jgi:uncharacterized protein HemX